ncbi:DNA polymerase IV [Lunatimonas lonarensis]|uniref:DNA polymerase IV n=1 Tax=Lunatimonas lonarensis TaxID=1232681 RepID=R7ZWV4_9BACT|nr:DNA polymerase IV [Lunatimonas lonarensis]EON78611.1 DNA polymerase IV [Lunatimonas lonarensis]
MDKIRKIIHVDMDAFYASVEQMDNPELNGKPVAVGGNRERGVVAAASYEARKFGVRSAMSSKIASLRCPGLVFVKPRFDRYKELSYRIRDIFYEYTDLVEPLSLDEAFLDVTVNKVNNPYATKIAREIRSRIKSEIGLNASAGISYNKFLAKIASDLNKPNGQAVITPDQATDFLERLPIERFFGIGKVTAEKMKKLGIHTGWDLKQYSLDFLSRRFGKSGLHYYEIVRGIHLSEVNPNRDRKSISVENTFERDLFSPRELLAVLEKLTQELFRRMERNELRGRTVTLKLKYKDFSVQTRSKSLSRYLENEEIILFSKDLLEQDPLKMPIRLMGIGISNLDIDEDRNGKQLRFEGFFSE